MPHIYILHILHCGIVTLQQIYPRFHAEEMDRAFWQYENSNILRDGNESIDSYVGHDLPLDYDRSYYKEDHLERDTCSPQSRYGRRYLILHLLYMYLRSFIDKIEQHQ